MRAGFKPAIERIARGQPRSEVTTIDVAASLKRFRQTYFLASFMVQASNSAETPESISPARKWRSPPCPSNKHLLVYKNGTACQETMCVELMKRNRMRTSVQSNEPGRTGGRLDEHLLFKPTRIGQLDLSSRVVMAPMTRGFAPNGVLGEPNADYYARRAARGVGLIISEGTWIPDPAADNRSDVPRFYGDDALAGWRLVLDRVHAAGGKMFPQLWHVGMARKQGNRCFNPEALSIGPSGLSYSNDERGYVATTEPMSRQRIDAVIDGFARAANDAMVLGFDGVELHGAHGYLIDQFLWNKTNRRTDEYGGSATNRAKFAAEIVAACRKRTHPDFPICFRFSQWKVDDYDAKLFRSPADLAALLEPLVDAGVDVFHCSTRRFWEPAFDGSDFTLAHWTKKISGKPTVAVGSVGLNQAFLAPGDESRELKVAPASLDRLLEMLEHGEFDLVAVGRAILADAEWVEKVRRGAYDELRPYTPEARAAL